MSLSKLAAKCQACPFVSTCGHKRMEEVGFLIPSVPVEQTTQRPEMDISQGSTTIEQIALQNSIAVDEIVRTISKELQLPERVLGRALTSTENEQQWQKFLEINGMR